MARRFVTASLGAIAIASALGAFAACGKDFDDNTPKPAVDSAVDTSLVGDTTAPIPDAPPEEGEVCGNRAGLDPSSPWPMRGGCPRRAGYTTAYGAQSAAIKWSVPLPSADSSPAVAGNGTLWFGTMAGEIYALTLSSVVRGVAKTGGPLLSSPVLAQNGIAVIGGSDGNLYGARLSNNAPVDAGDDADAGDAGDDADAAPPQAIVAFTVPLGPIASSPAIGGDGTIYVTTKDGKLFALTPGGTSTKWSVITGDTLGSSPAIGAGETVYVGSSDGKLYAITPDGKTAWSTPLGSSVTGSPSVGGDDTIYVGTTDGKLHAVDTAGKVKWSYATGGPITGTPAVHQGVIYVGSEDKKLHAVSSDGQRIWAYETLGAVASPVIAQNVIYVGASDARLYAINTSGSLFYAVNVKGRVRSTPAVGADQTVYVTTESSIVAVGP